MNSRHAISRSLKGCDRNLVAKEMGLAIGSLNNQIAGELPYIPKGKTQNFVDRVMGFMEAVEAENCSLSLLEWMAEQFSCIVIRNPAINVVNSPAISKISEILQDFAGVIDETGKAAADQRIEPHEAEKIRAKWEIMKRTTEEFVLGCETGIYDRVTPNAALHRRSSD